MSVRRCLLVSIAASVALIAYRTATFYGFTNDQYMHLAWAQQIVRGAWPVRDFVEPGMPLTVALSALAQIVGGRGLFAEFVLCTAMLATAAGLTCWLGARLTGSVTLGVCAAALQIAFFPRMYNYPKLVVPLVGLIVLWRYLDRPTARRAALMGGWLGVGFLFRHDYLLYLGIGTAAALLVRIAAQRWRPIAGHAGVCAATALITVLPYLIGLAAIGGLRAHIADTLEFGRGEAYQWLVVPAGITVDDPLSIRNAVAVLYGAAFVPPLALLLTSGRTVMRRRPRAPTVEEARLLVLATFALAVALGFVRHPIPARLPDVSGLMPLVLVAAVAALERRGLLGRIHARTAFAVVALAVIVHGGVWPRLSSMVTEPRQTVARFAEVWTTLQHRPPADPFWPGDSVPKSVRYLRACTSEQDRVFVALFAPQVFTFADRGFAAGHSYVWRRTFFALEHQQKMVRWLRRERPPVALLTLEPWFKQRFYLLQFYLDEEYSVVGTDHVGGESVAVAILRRSVPTGVDAETGWPCLSPARTSEASDAS